MSRKVTTRGLYTPLPSLERLASCASRRDPHFVIVGAWIDVRDGSDLYSYHLPSSTNIYIYVSTDQSPPKYFIQMV